MPAKVIHFPPPVRRMPLGVAHAWKELRADHKRGDVRFELPDAKVIASIERDNSDAYTLTFADGSKQTALKNLKIHVVLTDQGMAARL